MDQLINQSINQSVSQSKVKVVYKMFQPCRKKQTPYSQDQTAFRVFALSLYNLNKGISIARISTPI